MKYILNNKVITRYMVVALCLAFVVGFFVPAKVKAAEPYTFSYHATSDSVRDGYDYVTWDYYYEGDYKPFVFFLNRTTGTYKDYIMIAVAEYGEYVSCSCKLVYYKTDGSVSVSRDNYFNQSEFMEKLTYSSNGIYRFSWNDKEYVLCYLNLNTNPSFYPTDTFTDCPVFTYTNNTGITAGEVINIYKDIVENGRQPDRGSFFTLPDDEIVGPSTPDWYTPKHDFSSDVIDDSIPLPEVTNINLDGFVLNNRGDFFVDVMYECYLYGAKFDIDTSSNSNGIAKKLQPDYNWVYFSRYNNLLLKYDTPVDSDVVSIKNVYGEDIVATLVDAFKKWSEEYPKVSKLPTYSFFNGNYSSYYNSHYLYREGLDISDLEQLTSSGLAGVDFYIRYVDSEGNTGRWVRYKYKSTTIDFEDMNYKGAVDVEVLDKGSNGNSIVIDKTSGVVSNDNTGTLDFSQSFGSNSSSGNVSDIDNNLSGFNDMIDSFGDSTTKVSNAVSGLFGFLPWWCTGLIGAGIGAVVILRFVGR